MAEKKFQKGVLFTFLTFLFIGVIIGLILFRIQQDNNYSQTTIEVSVLNTINSKYDDITDDIITLDHPIGIPSIQQRILPFNYAIGTNTISFEQTIPITSGKLSLYYDLINAYSIFVKDQNTQHTFDGVVVNMDVPKSPAWGGTNQTAHFNILPQCVQYGIIDSNTVHFQSENTIGCANTFDAETSIQRIDMNIFLPTSVDDYTNTLCSIQGNNNCLHEDENTGIGPYIQMLFFDSNCTNCTLTPADKNISFHFNSGGWDTVTYDCNAGSCQSRPISISIGNGILFSHGGTPAQISMKVTFNENIETFYYQDINYQVKKQGFSTYKSNVVVFPQ